MATVTTPPVFDLAVGVVVVLEYDDVTLACSAIIGTNTSGKAATLTATSPTNAVRTITLTPGQSVRYTPPPGYLLGTLLDKLAVAHVIPVASWQLACVES